MVIRRRASKGEWFYSAKQVNLVPQSREVTKDNWRCEAKNFEQDSTIELQALPYAGAFFCLQIVIIYFRTKTGWK
jgi:hypothetical protein